MYKTFQAEIEMQSLKDRVEVVDTGCQGLCTRAPVVTVEPMGVFYGRVTESDVHEIVSRTVLKEEIIERLCCTEDGKRVPYRKDISFYKKQKKIVLRNCGVIDPKKISEYILRNGYAALEKVLSGMSPDKVIEEVKASGLRGRAGPDFRRGRSGSLQKMPWGDENMLSVTETKGILVHLWTVRCLRETLIL
ncbi:(2Fe-2S) ferredoxin domain-containing protein [Candidatus Kuenenia stuttgartensis]|uniref:(2Fe-2S) ferredoxin domain-containing protein n=1 Tax=Kuenenia stuttgartiensis TaxID=174633 RepID=UPI00146F164B|nr:(2Fe-2S) ferredoxin domain-containing protein [Candidatus Kuenenia stuttgartiensis]